MLENLKKRPKLLKQNFVWGYFETIERSVHITWAGKIPMPVCGVAMRADDSRDVVPDNRLLNAVDDGGRIITFLWVKGGSVCKVL